MTKKKDVRFILPKGFTAHHGDGCPVDAEQFVEPIIRTAEGFGSAGVMRAKYHDWTAAAHAPAGGLGEVVGYRLAERMEPPRFGAQERF